MERVIFNQIKMSKDQSDIRVLLQRFKLMDNKVGLKNENINNLPRALKVGRKILQRSKI